MRTAILTREYPPDVYGGAGVHVDFLVRELRALIDVDVHCMGEPREGATAHSEDDPLLTGANAALRIFAADLSMTAAVSQAVSIPVIASGGAGTFEHFSDVFTEGCADAALAASVFHFSEHAVSDLKAEKAA